MLLLVIRQSAWMEVHQHYHYNWNAKHCSPPALDGPEYLLQSATMANNESALVDLAVAMDYCKTPISCRKGRFDKLSCTGVCGDDDVLPMVSMANDVASTLIYYEESVKSN